VMFEDLDVTPNIHPSCQLRAMWLSRFGGLLILHTDFFKLVGCLSLRRKEI
nr:hypothetical protein [Tanacetum cinerariifolium]